MVRPDKGGARREGLERTRSIRSKTDRQADAVERGRIRAQLAPWQLKLARDMMRAQLTHGLELADVAARLDMSVNHFIRAFRHSAGMSPYHWYARRRIGRAMALMRIGTPIAQVAAACGFANQSHFTKAFKRISGTSPGRWRSTLRRKQ